MGGEVGLRERKKIMARQALEEAALRLFEERGFDETTVKDIAAEVQMSPRTFFRYFESKEDVVFKDVDPHLEKLRSLFAEVSTGTSAWTTLIETCQRFGAFLEQDRDWVLRKARIAMHTVSLRARNADVLNHYSHALATEIARREGRPDVSTRDMVLTGVAIAVMANGIAAWVIAGGESSLADDIRQAFAVVEEEIRSSA